LRWFLLGIRESFLAWDPFRATIADGPVCEDRAVRCRRRGLEPVGFTQEATSPVPEALRTKGGEHRGDTRPLPTGLETEQGHGVDLHARSCQRGERVSHAYRGVPARSVSYVSAYAGRPRGAQAEAPSGIRADLHATERLRAKWRQLLWGEPGIPNSEERVVRTSLSGSKSTWHADGIRAIQNPVARGTCRASRDFRATSGTTLLALRWLRQKYR